MKSKISISTDKEQLNIKFIHAFLTESYWAKGRTIQEVQMTIDNCLCFGIYDGSQQVGFARILTDGVVFAYLMDVFIDPAFRGQGLSKLMMQFIMEHPALKNIKKWLLKTRDAHGLYKQFGFKNIEEAHNLMEK